MNSLSKFLVDGILLGEESELYPSTEITSIHISGKVIEEWVVTHLPKILKEASKTGGYPEVDDGPNFFFRDFRVFDKVSKSRAEQIGYEVVKQIMDASFQDLTVYPEYPNGPVKSVTPFPAGVIGKTTATNQKDFGLDGAYDLWFKHARRVATIVGYSLVKDKDEIEKRLALSSAKDIYTDETADDPSSVTEQFFTKEELTSITDDIMNELGGLMIGYAGKVDIEKKQKQLKKLRKTLDKTTPNYPIVKETYDKLEFYLNYYKNLTPSGFSVDRENKNIVISINDLNESISILPKSLNISRNKMPQVSSKNIGDYIQFLKSNGIRVGTKKVKVSSVKMTQKEIDTDKVARLVKDDDRVQLSKPVIISKDGYILDGHHRILALYNLDKNLILNVIGVDLPIQKLIDITFEYPKVSTKQVNEGVIDGGEPEAMYIPDYKIRNLNKERPEPWFKQMGYIQMHFPKADSMRGRGKSKDTESTFRKVSYKTTNKKISTLKDVLKPVGTDKWIEINDLKKD